MRDDLAAYKWNWHWRRDDMSGEPDCGIYAMVREGHAYAVVRCPRYMTEDDWKRYAHHICTLHNASLDEDASDKIELEHPLKEAARRGFADQGP